MPFYLYEFKLSGKGLLNIKEIPSVIDHFTRGSEVGVEAVGGKVVENYYVFGENTFVTIAEFPDDETAERWNLSYPEDPKLEFWEPDFKVKKVFSLKEFTDIVKKLT